MISIETEDYKENIFVLIWMLNYDMVQIHGKEQSYNKP